MNAILRKTEAAQLALQARDNSVKLPVRLRTLLLQIDGQKSSDQLVNLALSLGNQPEALDKLIEMGLVEIVGPADAALPPTPTAPVAVQVAAPTPMQATVPVLDEVVDEVEDDGPDLPVSTKLPEHLRPVAAQMRELADAHLGLKAILLKRRISHCDTEQELRNALVALNDALGKATSASRASELLADVASHLPIIGLNRPQPYRR